MPVGSGGAGGLVVVFPEVAGGEPVRPGGLTGVVPREVEVDEGRLGGLGVQEVKGGSGGADPAVRGGQALARQGVQGAGESRGREVQCGAGGGQIGWFLRGQREEQSAGVGTQEVQVGVQCVVGWGASQVAGQEGGVTGGGGVRAGVRQEILFAEGLQGDVVRGGKGG
ncbi:hypothetical protein AUC44_05485 [Deinococcus actinosclerus]|uniref:Uncharacterized protein n=1 Tax=Deinococcus actinosclerus TaxID=1768108 RepID=A0ABM5X3Z8_9DEIO|nr:hypothetical protein AUC44_05485 [Deinococcus actinosclerus]